MNTIDNLAHLFMKFPGIGTRQAKRFVYFLLAQDPRFVDDLAREITELQKSIVQCSSCFRFYPRGGTGTECDVCAGDTDHATLLVVEKDTDFDNIRRTGSYAGHYFILGGTIPLLAPNPTLKIRMRELTARIERGVAEGLSEIILALSATPEGDVTREYATKTLEPLVQKYGITVTSLGRGISTGTELEYSDGDTLRHALKNRS